MERTEPIHPAALRREPTSRPVASRAGAAAWRLSAAVALLMAAQASIGLTVPSLYRDTGWVTAAWYGNDLVTLGVVVPVLAWALWAAARGSPRAELVWYAMLGYATYNYAYYLFGAALNVMFPVYAVLFVLPLIALVLALGSLDAVAVAERFASGTPRGMIAGYMLLTAIGLTTAWLAQWAAYVAAGTVPSIGVDAFQLVAAMDLTFMVPWFAIGAVLLWRRAPWGFVVAPLIVMQGAAYTLVLTATSAVAASRGVAGTAEQIPIWAGWTGLGILAAWVLLSNVRARPTTRL
jgi:hypothetical protein